MPKTNKSTSSNDGLIRGLLAGPHRATVEALISSGMGLDRVGELCRSLLPSESAAAASPAKVTAKTPAQKTAKAPKTEQAPYVWRSIPTGGFGILAPAGLAPGTYPVFVASKDSIVPTAVGAPTRWTDGTLTLYRKAGAE